MRSILFLVYWFYLLFTGKWNLEEWRTEDNE